MVARKLSSYDVSASPESFSKRPSVYIDPDSDIFEGLQYLHNIKRQNCINCLQLWKKSSAALEGIIFVDFKTVNKSQNEKNSYKILNFYIFLVSKIDDNLRHWNSSKFPVFCYTKTRWSIEKVNCEISRILGFFFLSVIEEAFMTTFTLFLFINSQTWHFLNPAWVICNFNYPLNQHITTNFQLCCRRIGKVLCKLSWQPAARWTNRQE